MISKVEPKIHVRIPEIMIAPRNPGLIGLNSRRLRMVIGFGLNASISSYFTGHKTIEYAFDGTYGSGERRVIWVMEMDQAS